MRNCYGAGGNGKKLWATYTVDHESYLKLQAQYEADTEVKSNRKYERKKCRIASSHITSNCIGNSFAESTPEKQNTGWYRFMAASWTIQTSNMHEDLLSSQSRQPATCALQTSRAPGQIEGASPSSAQTSAMVLHQQYIMPHLKAQFVGNGDHDIQDSGGLLGRVKTTRFLNFWERRQPDS
jgi:hypothetical protein